MNTETPQPQDQAQAQAQAEPQPQPQPQPQATYSTTPLIRRPRIGPIVWGVIFLGICGYIAVQRFAPGAIDRSAFVITCIFVLAALLLTIGAVSIRRASRGPR